MEEKITKAVRISDGKIIEIGISNYMYQVRYENISAIDPVPGDQTDPTTELDLIWRFPIMEEDGVKIGDFPVNLPVLKYNDVKHVCGIHKDCCLKQMVEKDLQWYTKLYHIGGNKERPCFHYLPQFGNMPKYSNYWDEYVSISYMAGIKNEKEEMSILISCARCFTNWSVSFKEIEPYILSMPMKKRLYQLCMRYWENRHAGETYTVPITKVIAEAKYSLSKCVNPCEKPWAVSVEKPGEDIQFYFFDTQVDAFSFFDEI